MIIDALVGALVAPVDALLSSLLPSSGPVLVDGSGFFHWYTWANGFLPLSEAIDLLKLSIGVVTILGVIWVVFWILRKIPLLNIS